MKEDRLVIVEGVRTPFCKAGTELASLGADELGRVAVNALLTRTGLDPALVDEVIFGCVAQPIGFLLTGTRAVQGTFMMRSTSALKLIAAPARLKSFAALKPSAFSPSVHLFCSK